MSQGRWDALGVPWGHPGAERAPKARLGVLGTAWGKSAALGPDTLSRISGRKMRTVFQGSPMGSALPDGNTKVHVGLHHSLRRLDGSGL